MFCYRFHWTGYRSFNYGSHGSTDEDCSGTQLIVAPSQALARAAFTHPLNEGNHVNDFKVTRVEQLDEMPILLVQVTHGSL